MDGKDRDEVSFNAKQWEDLKESMCDEEYLEKSERVNTTRELVKAQYFLGQGGCQAKQHIFVSIWLFVEYCTLCYAFSFVYISN